MGNRLADDLYNDYGDRC